MKKSNLNIFNAKKILSITSLSSLAVLPFVSVACTDTTSEGGSVNGVTINQYKGLINVLNVNSEMNKKQVHDVLVQVKDLNKDGFYIKKLSLQNNEHDTDTSIAFKVEGYYQKDNGEKIDLSNIDFWISGFQVFNPDKPKPQPNGGANAGEDVPDEPSNPNSENKPSLNIPGKPAAADSPEWKTYSEKQKTDAELEAYVDALKKYMNVSEGPKPANKNYDEEAQKYGQSSFFDAWIRNFSVDYGDGLVLRPNGKKYAVAAYWKSDLKNRGLPRVIPNDKYKDVLLQSFQISITNSNKYINERKANVGIGTAWILDYKIEEGQEYPTKWYLATNLHVAQDLTKTYKDNNTNYSNIVTDEDLRNTKAKLDELEKGLQEQLEKYNEILKNQGQEAADQSEPANKWRELNKELKLLEAKSVGLTEDITLYHFNELTPLQQDLNVTNLANTVDRFSFKPSQVKIVYAGNDFLNQNPSDYLANNSPYFNNQEMADFAVLEFDFSNPQNKYSYVSQADGLKDIEVNSVYELAKKATANYANWDKDRQLKFNDKSMLDIPESLANETEKVTLTNGREISIPRDDVNYIALGFPNAATDNRLTNEEIERIGRESLSFTSSVWVNKPFNMSKFTYDFGSGLNKGFSFRNWTYKKGVTDILITNPVIDTLNNNSSYYSANLKDTTSPYQGQFYLNYGLGMIPGAWEPLQGASGSSIRDINNNLIAINFAAGDTNGVSLQSIAQAFRSNGYDYGDLYGKYKLEEYDLIYGGGKNQRTSYRQALLAAYGDNYKTNLFASGLSDENVPEQFKFNK
ncbi:hypothetical protein FJO69_02010 [[Mycoplasma] falconis]|uniref:DUF31 domain-containing protein n=1 Tax=[Mycoplasma] falconis TaxID=92403 RepID=A0A501X9R7_9BACT|nr:variable surface lipoprotein [[Mycoplasma] falconis]TPE57262.1 hypothetical protein FJO69_02010 [[Mycoplasma] falconis]